MPETPAREHLYTIYAASRTGGLWKTSTTASRGTRSPTASKSPRSAPSPSRRPTRRSSGWAPANRRTRARPTPAKACSSPPMPARRGNSWACPTRTTSPASSSTRRIPTIVYVAAMGHLFSSNEERGVFRTRNGGKSWQKVLYVDDGTGATDLVINRQVAGHVVRRDVRETPDAVAARARRPGHRRLSQRRRRREVAEARRPCRPATSAASASTSIRATRTS